MTYDPDNAPPPTEWLGTDEGERVERVSVYHRRKRIDLPNLQLHAVIHVVVENQIALGETVVADTLARLQREGLSRHDALHAIGSVLSDLLYELLGEENRVGASYQRYLERLPGLSASGWRAAATP
jgi:hypothetical protein